VKYLVLATTLLLGACAQHSTRPANSLGTSVTGRNVNDISRDVQGWHNMQHADCAFNRVLGANIVKKESGSVVEHWTIEACNNQQFTYRVFIMFHQGGISDSVSNIDGSPAG
jgi:hypothetical protein